MSTYYIGWSSGGTPCALFIARAVVRVNLVYTWLEHFFEAGVSHVYVRARVLGRLIPSMGLPRQQRGEQGSAAGIGGRLPPPGCRLASTLL